LWVSEARYRSLFEDAPVALVEEDFTELRRHLASLREQGVTDLRTFFVEHAALIGETLAPTGRLSTSMKRGARTNC
jgi:hypothetical protein